LRAFARALLPATETLPGAEIEGGVEIVQSVEALIGAAPARTRALVRQALRAIEWAAPPGRLSRRSPKRAAKALETLESSRIAVRREMVNALKTFVCLAYCCDERVVEAVGTESVCEVDEAREEALAEEARGGTAGADGGATEADAAKAPPPLHREDMIAGSAVEECDVVIVGSGAGGAAAARVLAERGLDVIVVEAGRYHDASDYRTDPREALAMLYREAGLTLCEGRPAIPLPVGQAVGGTTVINSGTCLRAPERVLERWAEEFGIEWATELDAEYAEVERALKVTEVDPATAGRNATLCRRGADALGYENGPLRRNAGAVKRCSSCPTGCAKDAKCAVHMTELPRAVAAGARVRAGQPIRRIVTEGGKAVGVEGYGYEVKARAVVLAAGALGTPQLLMGQGTANSSGAVGAHLRIHPACWVGARFEEEVNGWDGIMQSWGVDEFADRGLFLEATATPLAFGAQWLPGVGEPLQRAIEEYGKIGVIGVHLAERGEGRLETRGRRLRITYRLHKDDVQALRYGIARAAEIHRAAGATEIYPHIGRRERLKPSEIDRIERGRPRAGALRLEAFHPMGTTRMGADPRSCVVDPSGETHDVSGLYVADAGLFPTSLGVNPMLTIMACARRIASTIADDLG
jgi:choline dehydrogenase-like flavoprotein